MGNPTWMYRLDAQNRHGRPAKIEAEIFDSDDLPAGWVDSPDKCGPPEPVGIVAETDGAKIMPRKPGRPKKVTADDDSA